MMSQPQTGRKACKLIKLGTVLAIPATPGKWVIGQVLHADFNFYLGIALTEFDEMPEPNQINREKFELFSWTTDGEVYRGGWWVLGIAESPPDFDFPEYHVCSAGEEAVKSFFGDYLRPFDPILDRDTRREISRSPMLVQAGVQAAFGIGKRQDTFEEMMKK